MTPCHENGRGCIRAFEDGTCGEQGQCSTVLAVLAERERCAKIAEEREPIERLLPFANDDMNKGAEIGQYEAGERIAEAIRKDPSCPK